MSNFNFIIVGLSIILLYIYSRFIVTKLPKDLVIQPEMIISLAYTCIFITFAFLTILSIYSWYKLRYNIKKTNILIDYFKRHLSNIMKFFYKSLKSIDDLVKHKIMVNHTGRLLKSFGLRLNHFFYSTISKKYLIIYLACNVIPRLCVLFIFSVDILILHKFQYIYKAVFLLIIPLVYNYLVFTYKEFSEYNIHGMLQNVLIFRFKDKSIMTTQDMIDFTLDDESKPHRYTAMPVELSEELTQLCYDRNHDITYTLAYYLPQFQTFIKLRKIVSIFEILHAKYNIYFSIIRFLLYTLLWLYILIHSQIITVDLLNVLLEITNNEDPFAGIDLTQTPPKEYNPTEKYIPPDAKDII